jgi:uncharacterized protein YutE (UPF0331/DUF86 family)
MHTMLQVLHELVLEGEQKIAENRILTAAMERALHLSIEAIADVGNALIDGFIMRDPGSYTDIVEILRDERVIDDNQAKVLTDVVLFRKHLVNEYTQVPVQQMVCLAKESLPTLVAFAPKVQAYLEQELF